MTVLTIDSDLITFFKFAVSIGGILLALYAAIGVTFFGWDVASARKSLKDAEIEVQERLKMLHTDFKSLAELKDKLEQLGAELEDKADLIDDMKKRKWSPASPEAFSESKSSKPPLPSEPPAAPDALFSRAKSTRSDLDIVREVIESSDFEWTTIARLMKKTGLTHEKILSIARATPDIVIGFGKRTNDHLFKLSGRTTVSEP